jgi:hypothetical protein
MRVVPSWALLFLFVALSLLLAGCSKAGGSAIHLKAPGMTEKDLAVKSGGAFAVTKTFTDVNRNITTAPSYRVYVANYDLDTANFGLTMNKPLASDDQVRVTFCIVGDVGGNEKTPPKAGTYPAKADKYMKAEDVSIVTRKDGKDNEVFFDRSGLAGEVKVTSVSGDTISGEVDLTSGEMSMKGPFTAKVLVRK